MIELKKAAKASVFLGTAPFFDIKQQRSALIMKKMCYLLTMGLLAGSLTVPVFAASDADSASDKK